MNGMKLHRLVFGRLLIIDVEAGFQTGGHKPQITCNDIISIFFWLKCSSSKLFVWLLSRRIFRVESAGKGAVIGRKKPSRDCLEKDLLKGIISEFFLSAEDGVKFWWKWFQKQMDGKESGLEQK